MQYIVIFLEGVTAFISPCLLPLLPVYISYFAGESGRVNALKNSASFVLGFSSVFILLGAFAGSIGGLLSDCAVIVNLITGCAVVLFGLNYLGLLDIKIINRSITRGTGVKKPGFFSSAVFGAVFSIGWTPCVGAFLGSALMLASQQGSMIRGMLLLGSFSMGLGIPFIASAVLIKRLKNTFDCIKRNYNIINKISGWLLILIGILMMTGFMGYFLRVLSF